MKTGVAMLATLLMLGAAAFAQSVDGRTLVIKTDGKVQNVPVSVPCEGSGPVVVEAEGGAKFPATLREGELTFIYTGSGGKATVHKLDKMTEPAVKLTKVDGEPKIDVRINGELFTSFCYSSDVKRPYLWPVLSEGGVPVTRAWPMGEPVEGYKQDHPHHKSLYTAYGDINGVDCWSDVEDGGWTIAKNVQCGSGDAYGWITAEVSWEDKDHKPLLTEQREYRFYNTPASGRLLDADIKLEATNGKVTIGDTKEGGFMAVRVRPEMSGDNGTITNALGDVGEENTWGKPSPWCDYSAPLGDAGWRGITIFDNPGNLRYPTSWHVRSYGLMGASCFGWSEFTKKDYNKPLIPGTNGTYEIPAGDSLTFDYRVYIHSGDVKKAGVAARDAEYTKPPAVSWE